MAGHHDARVLYEISNVQAQHVRNGEVVPLTSGPQTMSLLMLPTSSPFADLSSSIPQNEIPENDFYLHIHISPEINIPMLAKTQVFRQPPRAYLIPRREPSSDSGSYTRIEFSPQARFEDLDTFETILAQCTSFMERAPPPTGDAGHAPYNPAEYAAGGRLGGGKTAGGQLVLIDEENGSVVGELSEGAQIIEDPTLGHGEKTPVQIEISEDGKRISVAPASEEYLRLARMPAYRDSSMVQNAAAASRLIVTTSTRIGDLLNSGAENFVNKTKPNEKQMEFSPAARERVRKLHAFTQSGRSISAKTVGEATRHAQNLAATIARKGDRSAKGHDKNGKPISKPGLLNKSMIAFSTVLDGVAESGKSLLNQSSTAATTVVSHKYGPQAGEVAGQIAGGVTNVALVYVDVTGVTRRAIIKSVAKGMVVGKVRGGGNVVVGGGDGGSIPEADIQRAGGKDAGVKNDGQRGSGEIGFGDAAGGSAPYRSELGEPLGSSFMPEKNTQI